MPNRRPRIADALLLLGGVFLVTLAANAVAFDWFHLTGAPAPPYPTPQPAHVPTVRPVPSIVAAGARAAVAMATRQAPTPTDTPYPTSAPAPGVPNCASVPSGHCQIPPTPAPPATAQPHGGLPVCPTVDPSNECWKLVTVPTPTPRAAAPTSMPIGSPP